MIGKHQRALITCATVPTSRQREPPEYKALSLLDKREGRVAMMEVRLTAYSPSLYIHPSRSCPCFRHHRTQSLRWMRFTVSRVGVVRVGCGQACVKPPRASKSPPGNATSRVDPAAQWNSCLSFRRREIASGRPVGRSCFPSLTLEIKSLYGTRTR